ncbi:BlaI/MecI/CopY family transcriptional regulator, partial [Streptococcus suis]
MEQTISAAEWQVMRVLWAYPGATSQEIIQALQEGFDWQATTIKTLLGRLRKKNYLRMDKETSK